MLGVFIAPMIFVVFWSYPFLEHSAFQKWVIINTVSGYVAFLILGFVSHVALKFLHWTKLWQYCATMAVVAFIAFGGYSISSLDGYQSLYHSQTQVVENGIITKAGYVLYARDAGINALIAVCSMAIFWFVAGMRSPSVPRDA